MKYIIILVLFVFSNIEIQAQSLNDGMYSNGWEEERDLYCKKIHSATLAKSASISLASMGNADVSSIVRPDRKGGLVNAGFEYVKTKTIRSGGIRVVADGFIKRDVRQQNVKRAVKIRQSKSSPSSFMLYRRQQIAIASQKAHEHMIMEKLRKKREDDRSELIARQNYYQRTEQAFRASVVRDNWHATEGAKIIDESLRPSDYFTIPQKVEKKNDSGLIILTEFSLQKNVSLNENATSIPVTDLTAIRPEVIDDWISVLEADALVDIDSAEGENISSNHDPHPILLVSHNELLLDSAEIFVIPGCGPVMILEDSMLVLKDYQLRKVAWKDNLLHTYVIPCGNFLISRINNKIYTIYNGASKCLLELDTNNFSIFSNDNKSFFFVAYYDEISAIYKVDVVNQKCDEICRIPLSVWKIEAYNDDIYALLGNRILSIGSQGTKPCVLYNVVDGLNDMVLSPWGMLVATNNSIFRLNSIGEKTIFYKDGAKQIWIDGNEVYFLSLKGDLLYFEDGSNYL